TTVRGQPGDRLVRSSKWRYPAAQLRRVPARGQPADPRMIDEGGRGRHGPQSESRARLVWATRRRAEESAAVVSKVTQGTPIFSANRYAPRSAFSSITRS